MRKKITVLSALFALAALPLKAQQAKQDATSRKFFVGSTFALLGNFIEKNNPEFVQLNAGYRITPKDAVSLEFKTWKYAWPLGIPLFGGSYEAPGENFPGYIREAGFALVYQRFLWKGLYAGVHVMNAWQTFRDEEGNKVGDGFQIFNTYRIGYQFKFFNARFFFEPSIAVTHRPYHTKMPEGFKQVDDKWPKYLIGEPGLHFGFNF